MKGIIKTAVILSLGIAPSVALAQGNSTEGGAQAESGAGQSGSQRPQSETMPKDAQGGKTIGAGGPPATEPGTQEEGGSSDANGKQTQPDADVTTEQRTEMRQIIAEEKVEPVASADFDVSIGMAVPRTVEVHPLPPRIVTLVPAYEGYKYFVLADGRIVIVDPNSLQIVYIITA